MAAQKSSLPSPRTSQAENTKALGGLPPKKDVEAIMKVNTPGGRKRAPDSIRG